MSQESLIIFAGFMVLAVPFLGIPNAIDKWVLGCLGVIIAIIGYRLRRAAYLRSLETQHGERRADAFVENHRPTGTDTSIGRTL